MTPEIMHMSEAVLASRYRFEGTDGQNHIWSASPPKNWPRHTYNAVIQNVLQMPHHIAALPVSEKGYPVPWFASWVDDKPDFLLVHPARTVVALRRDICWICGQPLTSLKNFIGGPMCAINRITVDPPSHNHCADYAISTCPFLINPRMVRNTQNYVDTPTVAGIGYARNPGICVKWQTKEWSIARQDDSGLLIRMGIPKKVTWHTKGELADFAQCYDSIRISLQTLIDATKHDDNPVAGLRHLRKQFEFAVVNHWLPSAPETNPRIWDDVAQTLFTAI